MAIEVACVEFKAIYAFLEGYPVRILSDAESNMTKKKVSVHAPRRIGSTTYSRREFTPRTLTHTTTAEMAVPLISEKPLRFWRREKGA